MVEVGGKLVDRFAENLSQLISAQRQREPEPGRAAPSRPARLRSPSPAAFFKKQTLTRSTPTLVPDES